MFVAILGAVGLVSQALDAACDASDAIRDEDERKTKAALRSLAGVSAMSEGETEDVEVPQFVELPPDPAFGGVPVLLTHEEAIWWMSASQEERMSKNVRKIRKILMAQPSRRQAACSAH